MSAKSLVEIFGKRLIGRQVATEAIGDWPGGVATIFALSLDKHAPEIVYNVRSLDGAEIGVFEGEEARLLPPGASPP